MSELRAMPLSELESFVEVGWRAKLDTVEIAARLRRSGFAVTEAMAANALAHLKYRKEPKHAVRKPIRALDSGHERSVARALG